MGLSFRDLRADEIECRVQQVGNSPKGVYAILLLYKNARADMTILDETVGQLNWQRNHKRDNANCVVSIWDADKVQWVEKEDTGTESFTEAEKGLASDSFKRACTNWGIGRELYTSPFIYIEAEGKDGTNFETYDKNGKPQAKADFSVIDVVIKNKKIVGLTIMNLRNGKVVFSFGESSFQKCENCGEPIVPVKKRDGTLWESADMVAYSTHAFKKALCSKCMKGAQK